MYTVQLRQTGRFVHSLEDVHVCIVVYACKVHVLCTDPQKTWLCSLDALAGTYNVYVYNVDLPFLVQCTCTCVSVGLAQSRVLWVRITSLAAH